MRWLDVITASTVFTIWPNNLTYQVTNFIMYTPLISLSSFSLRQYVSFDNQQLSKADKARSRYTSSGPTHNSNMYWLQVLNTYCLGLQENPHISHSDSLPSLITGMRDSCSEVVRRFWTSSGARRGLPVEDVSCSVSVSWSTSHNPEEQTSDIQWNSEAGQYPSQRNRRSTSF